MSLIIDMEFMMRRLAKYSLAAATLGLGLSAGPMAAAQMPSGWSAKQLEKRSKKLSQLSPEHFANTATVNDSDLETKATISTQNGFHWRGGFSSRVRSDNFLRAFVDKQSGEALWQLYQTIEYTGEWRRFTSVNIKLPSGLVRREISIIESKVETCAYGTCIYRETLGFDLSHEELEALIFSSSEAPHTSFRFKFSSQNGLDWTDDISVAEIEGALLAVERYRTQNGLN